MIPAVLAVGVIAAGRKNSLPAPDVFATPGGDTWTAPAAGTYRFDVWGAGAAGAKGRAGVGNQSGGGGGGSGAFSTATRTVDEGNTFGLNVGLGGSPDSADGGPSSVFDNELGEEIAGASGGHGCKEGPGNSGPGGDADSVADFQRAGNAGSEPAAGTGGGGGGAPSENDAGQPGAVPDGGTGSPYIPAPFSGNGGGGAEDTGEDGHNGNQPGGGGGGGAGDPTDFSPGGYGGHGLIIITRIA